MYFTIHDRTPIILKEYSYKDPKIHPSTDLIRYQSRIIKDNPSKDHKRYNYYEPSQSSIPEIETFKIELAAKKSRALDFCKSCEYAVSHFKALPNVTSNNIDFFEKDYKRRLDDKFCSLNSESKNEF